MDHGREVLGMDVIESAVTPGPSYAMDYEALLVPVQAENGTNVSLLLGSTFRFIGYVHALSSIIYSPQLGPCIYVA